MLTWDPGGCMFFFGKFSETCKLIGYIVLAILCTIFVWITPCYLIAKKVYKALPKQVQIVKQEYTKK